MKHLTRDERFTRNFTLCMNEQKVMYSQEPKCANIE